MNYITERNDRDNVFLYERNIVLILCSYNGVSIY